MSTPIPGLQWFYRVGSDFLVGNPDKPAEYYTITRLHLRTMLDYSVKIRTLPKAQHPLCPLGYSFVCRAYNADTHGRGLFSELDEHGKYLLSNCPEPDEQLIFGVEPDDVTVPAEDASVSNRLIRAAALANLHQQEAVSQRRAMKRQARPAPYVNPFGAGGQSSGSGQKKDMMQTRTKKSKGKGKGKMMEVDGHDAAPNTARKGPLTAQEVAEMVVDLNGSDAEAGPEAGADGKST
jgi:hypothetical protein